MQITLGTNLKERLRNIKTKTKPESNRQRRQNQIRTKTSLYDNKAIKKASLPKPAIQPLQHKHP